MMRAAVYYIDYQQYWVYQIWQIFQISSGHMLGLAFNLMTDFQGNVWGLT